jgi:hypothetical protein
VSDPGLCFLAHVGDPFSVVPLRLIRCDSNGSVREIGVEDFGKETMQIVSYDLRTLIDACRLSNVNPPALLVDIADALRLLGGRSRAQGGEKLWDFWAFASAEDSQPYDPQTLKAIVEGKAPPPSEDAKLLEMLIATAKTIHHVWRRVSAGLVDQQEDRRFFTIESPVRRIFSLRQHGGLLINLIEMRNVIDQATKEKYTAFRSLASMLGFSPAGLSFRNIGNFLQKTDAAYLSEYSSSDQLEQYFKLARQKSTFADAFLTFIKAGRTLSVLRTIDSSAGRLYPTFECIGTVTARILVADPRLQQLPKQFRSILSPDEGHCLWYFDYAQFEPGVLAALMEDAIFIDFYESSDVYSALSKAIFGNESQRETCKIIFLAYCYGMSAERISEILARGSIEQERDRLTASISTFFNAVPSLASYRQEMQELLLREGYVSSVMGNRRYRTNNGPLSAVEKRWALNQRIQGTASLIFKQAIIDLAEAFGPESILLPMHDAILMQFEERRDPKKEVEEIMVRSFQEWCPNVKPRIIAGDFVIHTA